MAARIGRETSLHQELRRGAPPAIKQEAFDFDDRHLRRLVKLRPGDRAEAGDLFDYTQDLRYTEIQTDLLRHLLPFCLGAWLEDLHGTSAEYGGFVEQFYPVLADCQVFDTHLSPKQTAAVSEFMRESILEEIDDQRGLVFQGSAARPYRWIRAFTTYGVLLPDIEQLWVAWWSLNTIGQAVAVLQYTSCLMFPEDKNPVFSAWTPDRGGGPPCLWEFEGFLYAHRWLQPNIEFLKRTLSVETTSRALSRAVERLAGEPEQELATRMKVDFPLHQATVEARCSELPRLLQTRDAPLGWST
jgi:hypothetical protein